jgi:acyl-CoA thioesterase-1
VHILVLELGGNDGLRGISPDLTEKNLNAIIDRVREKYPDAQFVVAGMRMPENMGADYTSRFREVFSRVAKEKKAALVPFLLEGVGGRPHLNQADRIHPTAEGQRVVAENLWKTLKPLLKDKAARN